MTRSLDTSYSLSVYEGGPSLAGSGGPVPTLAAEEKEERWCDLHSKIKSGHKDIYPVTLQKKKKKKKKEEQTPGA